MLAWARVEEARNCPVWPSLLILALWRSSHDSKGPSPAPLFPQRSPSAADGTMFKYEGLQEVIPKGSEVQIEWKAVGIGAGTGLDWPNVQLEVRE